MVLSLSGDEQMGYDITFGSGRTFGLGTIDVAERFMALVILYQEKFKTYEECHNYIMEQDNSGNFELPEFPQISKLELWPTYLPYKVEVVSNIMNFSECIGYSVDFKKEIEKLLTVFNNYEYKKENSLREMSELSFTIFKLKGLYFQILQEIEEDNLLLIYFH